MKAHERNALPADATPDVKVDAVYGLLLEMVRAFRAA